jgi:putative spermidine/putrescine transport system permease protein
MNTGPLSNPSGGSPLRRFSNLLYRPNLYLSLLLVPPLLWFGAIYLGSLLTLLWQGFYTFDDFTMAVTPDLTLANFAALFQPSNFDIILRTLSMAIVVSSPVPSLRSRSPTTWRATPPARPRRFSTSR